METAAEFARAVGLRVGLLSLGSEDGNGTDEFSNARYIVDICVTCELIEVPMRVERGVLSFTCQTCLF